ncbi:MAG: ATP-binding protein [Acetobacteraceae bacterium]
MRFRCTDRAAFTSLRAKILLSFLGLTAITGLLGFGAVHSVAASGRLVMQIYDEPLMAISHVRKAQTEFTAMRLALALRDAAADPDRQQQSDRQLATLAGNVEDDLGVARERASSGRAAEVARAALDDFQAWNVLRLQREPDTAKPPLRDALDRRAESLLGEFDTLRQVTAEDCIRDRTRTMASIQRYRLWCVGATAAALLIGTLIAAALARHIVLPIGAASRAARRIAAGDLDAEILPAGRDELGQLLSAMSVMRDNIRTMMEHEAAAHRSAQGRLVNAIEGLNEGIALVGPDRRVIHANSQLAALFPAYAAGFTEGAVLPPETEAALAANPASEIQIADGRWLRLSRSERSDGGFVLIASDITLLKEREAVLQAAKEQAEAANRAKTEFLTNMSHELRTPLTAIIGFSEIISNESFGTVGQPKYREFADDILHSGRHLLDVINDMLDIAKLQSGMTELRLQRVPSRSIVDAAVRIVRKHAEQAGIRLELLIPRNLPMLRADHLRLRQVLLNLLSNAIKFTPAGGVVSVIAERRETELAITVRDTGIGMAPEDIPRALQPFVQVDNSLARRHGGTGLGLPLSKRFVDLHGGQFEIHSEPGKGTSVTIVLPIPYTSPAILTGDVAA